MKYANEPCRWCDLTICVWEPSEKVTPMSSQRWSMIICHQNTKITDKYRASTVKNDDLWNILWYSSFKYNHSFRNVPLPWGRFQTWPRHQARIRPQRWKSYLGTLHCFQSFDAFFVLDSWPNCHFGWPQAWTWTSFAPWSLANWGRDVQHYWHRETWTIADKWPQT